MRPHRLLTLVVCACSVAAGVVIGNAGVAADNPHDGTAGDVIAHWTPARVASAVPRDLVVDSRGLGYLRSSNGGLTPYGHSQRAQLEQLPTGTPIPHAKPGGGGNDSTAPSVTEAVPSAGATTGGTVEIAATITDASGIRSVSITVSSGVTSQTFAANDLGGNRYGATITGFTDGTWAYTIVARDASKGAGNTATFGPIAFLVDTGGGGPVDPGVVVNSPWTKPGDLQLAAGRILFEMPTIRGKRTTWNAYVCSGTVVTDTNSNASVILTAAHCVYDDVAKAFARNVLFIPDQDETTGTGTDSDCGNDPIGCWSPSHGVVDANWTTQTFPANVEWDYAYYVVPNTGSSSNGLDSLESSVNELTIHFNTGVEGNVTHALGYSYSDDPNFMYCSEVAEIEGSVNWWLPNCDLSGGSSGGPWVQPMNPSTGAGPIVSVNSWGYTTGPGMAGPHLDNSAECVFAQANSGATPVDGGVVVSGCTG
ncbi:MAG TPA: hypothetical protein VMM60_15750 [Ilumatobacter sp.]|nr:hypothetical protein [Ilumatobacter sp.]